MKTTYNFVFVLGFGLSLAFAFLFFLTGDAGAYHGNCSGFGDGKWGIHTGDSNDAGGLVVVTEEENGANIAGISYTLQTVDTDEGGSDIAGYGIVDLTSDGFDVVSYNQSKGFRTADGNLSTDTSSTNGRMWCRSPEATADSFKGDTIFGYGSSNNYGNTWTLWCWEIGSSGSGSGSNAEEFKIKSVETRAGRDGYWSASIEKYDGTGKTGKGNSKDGFSTFGVTNGATKVYRLTWHDDAPSIQADYIVQNLTISPSSPLEGDAITYSGTVKNRGSSEAGTSSTTRFKLDVNDNGSFQETRDHSTANLAAGATEVESWSTSVDWVPIPGDHSFTICADVNNAISESSESNNCTEKTFTVREKQGTILGRIWLDDNANGVRDAGEFYLRDTGATNPDSDCTNFKESGGLAVKYTSTDSVKAIYCNSAPYYSTGKIDDGTYTVSLTVPAGWVVTAVTNADDNDTNWTVQADKSIKGFLGNGDKKDIHFGVKGTGKILGRIWIDSDGDGVPEDPPSGSELFIRDPSSTASGCTDYSDVSGFAVSYSGPVISSTKPIYCNSDPYYVTDQLPIGTYTASLIVPADWQVTKALNKDTKDTVWIEDPTTHAITGFLGGADNKDIWFGVRPPLPNLIAENLQVLGTKATGQTLTFSGTVKNVGTLGAPASTARFRLDVGNDGSWEVSNLTVPIAALGPGGSQSVSFSWTASQGTHKIELWADIPPEPNGVVVESNENDNRAELIFDVSNALAWIMTKGGDVAVKGNISLVPPAGTLKPAEYAVIASGDITKNDNSPYNASDLSSKSWKLRNYSNLKTPPRSTYDYFWSLLSGKISPADGAIGNGVIPTDAPLTGGVYAYFGKDFNVNLANPTLTLNGPVVIFVGGAPDDANVGSMKFTSDIKLDPASKGGIIFIVEDKIIVQSNVKEIHGVFILGGKFESKFPSGTDPDEQLKVKGSVIAHGGFSLTRDRKSLNEQALETSAAEFFEFQPRYLVEFRELIGAPAYSWTEVSP